MIFKCKGGLIPALCCTLEPRNCVGYFDFIIKIFRVSTEDQLALGDESM